MRRDDEHVLELLPAYALGAASTDEMDCVERHVDACAACRSELDALLADAAALAQAVPMVEPPSALRERVLHGIDAHEELIHEPRRASLAPKPARTWRWRQFVAPVACVALLVVVIAQGVRIDGLNDDLHAARQHQSGVDGVSQLLARDTRVIPTSGALAVARANVAVGDRDRTALVLQRLPQPPSGKSWQAWAISTTGAKVSIGVVDRSSPMVVIDLPARLRGRVSAIAITLEQSGGAAQPTTPPVAFGKLAA